MRLTTILSAKNSVRGRALFFAEFHTTQHPNTSTAMNLEQIEALLERIKHESLHQACIRLIRKTGAAKRPVAVRISVSPFDIARAARQATPQKQFLVGHPEEKETFVNSLWGRCNLAHDILMRHCVSITHTSKIPVGEPGKGIRLIRGAGRSACGVLGNTDGGGDGYYLIVTVAGFVRDLNSKKPKPEPEPFNSANLEEALAHYIAECLGAKLPVYTNPHLELVKQFLNGSLLAPATVVA